MCELYVLYLSFFPHSDVASEAQSAPPPEEASRPITTNGDLSGSEHATEASMSHSHMTEDGTYEPISVGAQVGHYFLFAAACAPLRATRFVLTLPSQ